MDHEADNLRERIGRSMGLPKEMISGAPKFSGAGVARRTFEMLFFGRTKLDKPIPLTDGFGGKQIGTVTGFHVEGGNKIVADMEVGK